MNASQFINKWANVELSERSACQQHFLNLCQLLGHPEPADADPTGETFTFERGVGKTSGGDGWADVWKRFYFGWEYKGKKKNLDVAYQQLLQYRESLENPPLLVVCDLDRIVIHTNFTNTPHHKHEILLQNLADPANLALLRAVFFAPEKLHPLQTAQAITETAANRIGSIAVAMRARGVEPHHVARFLDRIVFCLFAEDVGLLPDKIFTRTVQNSRKDAQRLARQVGQLWEAMAHGGDYGPEEIRHFNGSLFDDAPVLEMTLEEIEIVRHAAELDWSGVDPSIFGTLFERGLDPDKRSQLGAHYTSRDDIETLVEPVVLQPLRREWAAVRDGVEQKLNESREKLQKVTELESSVAPGERRTQAQIDSLSRQIGRTRKEAEQSRSQAVRLIHDYLERLAQVRVLDPACGSGNFLYVTLQKLKDLEKEVITHALACGFTGLFPQVHPSQLYGIEVNPYAFDLAQMTVWIGYLQWHHNHGYPVQEKPVLRPLADNYRCMDAILDLSDPANPREPEWPEVDFIIGNPPFLGDKKMRAELGDQYVGTLRNHYAGRVPGGADFVLYWFERARARVEDGCVKRVGLLSTNSVRQATNRPVLERIAATGGIFWAWSDRPWFLDGASVRVSMVGFDDGTEVMRSLNGSEVSTIHSDLSSDVDVTTARPLICNRSLSFVGDCKKGSFDLTSDQAFEMLLAGGNPNGRPNSDVLVPTANAADVTGRERGIWLVDFGMNCSLERAALYEQPFSWVQSHVKPDRDKVRSVQERTRWWLHARPAPDMRRAAATSGRYLATPQVARHRVFAWLRWPVLPAHKLIVFAKNDDCFLGVLHSCIHEVWSLALCSWQGVGNDPVYTPTTCFETFPFPEPTPPQEAAIAAAAEELDRLRTNWLNPPEWTREEVLEFPGATDGPWARFVHDADSRGIGTVRYPRIVPKNAACAEFLAKRTLTNLYNQRPTWLQNAHRKLDEAVFDAYGWPPDLTDDQILERLLALNRERR